MHLSKKYEYDTGKDSPIILKLIDESKPKS